MNRRIGFILALISVVVASPLSAQGTAGKSATPLATRKIAAKVSLTASEIVYLDELEATFDDLEKAAKGSKMSSKDKLKAFTQRVDYVLFKQFGERESIKVTDAEIAARINELKAQSGSSASDAMIQASLIAQGVLVDTKSYLREDIIFSRYVMAKKQDELKEAGKYEVSEFTKAYDDMKFNLRRPDMLRFSMILANLQGKSEADKKKAQDALAAASKQLKVNPALFDEFIIRGLVDQNAGYVSAPSGTIYKTQESKKQNAAIYDAAFSLKEGQVSDVIDDGTRVCIIRATEYLPEKQLGLTDLIGTLPATGTVGYLQSISPGATVVDLIAYELRTSKSEAFSVKMREEIFSEIRKKATIKVSLATLGAFLDPAEVESLKAMQGEYNFTFE